jgi:uncharacterized protein YcbK (DUF882 family)
MGYISRVSLPARFAAVVLASVPALTAVTPRAAPEAVVSHGSGLGSKKGVVEDAPEAPPLLATLVQIHTGERVALDAESPTQADFDALLADRATGERHTLDPELLALLRKLAAKHPGGRVELVSGYRSPKLNEMLRKKGHHVASHSQHSLGHACDFRLAEPGQERGLDPRVLEQEIRELGWQGGVGVYPTHDDWFVHADVGPLRSWTN